MNSSPIDALLVINPEMRCAEDMLERAREQEIFQSRRFLRTRDLTVVGTMVCAGAGIGLLPETVLVNLGKGNYKVLAGSPIHRDRICLIWHSETQTSKASKLIRDTIIANLQQEDGRLDDHFS